MSLESPEFIRGEYVNESKHKDYRIYSLDWTNKDTKCLQHHNEWNSKYWDRQNIPFLPSLPQKYDTWLINMKFAIPVAYKREITRNAKRAVEEWNVERSFDTNVREFCLLTAQVHAFVAFYLLEDCAYDIENQDYYRKNHNDRFLIKHALAYKFWAHQTGKGCVRHNAKLDDVKKYVCEDDFVLTSDNDILKKTKIASEFLEKIDTLEKEWEKVSPCVTESNNTIQQ